MQTINQFQNKPIQNKRFKNIFSGRRVVFILLSVVCMITIFVFSSRDGDESTSDSSSVGRIVARIFHSDFESWTIDEQEDYVSRISYPVRKTAHAMEYALLCFLFAGVAWPFCSWRRILSPWICAVLYAFSDEIHQLFVPQRTCSLTDVCIDGAGAACGLFAMWIIFFLSGKIIKHRRTN